MSQHHPNPPVKALPCLVNILRKRTFTWQFLLTLYIAHMAFVCSIDFDSGVIYDLAEEKWDLGLINRPNPQTGLSTQIHSCFKGCSRGAMWKQHYCWTLSQINLETFGQIGKPTENVIVILTVCLNGVKRNSIKCDSIKSTFKHVKASIKRGFNGLTLHGGERQTRSRSFGRMMRLFFGRAESLLAVRRGFIGAPANLRSETTVAGSPRTQVRLAAVHGERKAGKVWESLGLTVAHHPEQRWGVLHWSLGCPM